MSAAFGESCRTAWCRSMTCLRPDRVTCRSLLRGPAATAAHVAAITFDLRWWLAGRTQPRRTRRRRAGNISGGGFCCRCVDTLDDPDQLFCRRRVDVDALAVVRWHAASASWFRSGCLCCAVPRNRDRYRQCCPPPPSQRLRMPACSMRHQTVVALWRSPERMISAKASDDPPAIVDVASFGEMGIIAARRGANNYRRPFRMARINVAARVSGAPT